MSIVQWLWREFQPPSFFKKLLISKTYEKTELSHKSLKLESRAWQVGTWGVYRSACIQAPKIEIVNSFFFPDPRWQSPILALQAVVLTHQPQIFIIDMDFLSKNSNSYILSDYQRIRETLNDLPNDLEMPTWYQQCRSSRDIFRRPTNWAETQRLSEAYLRIANQYWEGLPSSQLLDISEIEEHAHALQYYKDFHRLNTSGLKFLQQSFGADWTDEFLRYFYA